MLDPHANVSLITQLNSSASSLYVWYVAGSSTREPHVWTAGRLETQTSSTNEIFMLLEAITLLPVTKARNWFTALPSRDLIYLFR